MPQRNFNIYYTEYTPDGAEYIIRHSDLRNHNATPKRLSSSEISGRMVAATSPKLLQVLALDKPDYIITDADNRDEPVLTIEFSTQKPVGQNEMQRYARAAASVINEVPAAFFFAGKAFMQHKDGSWHLREAHKVYMASAKASQIYDTPILTFDWPFDQTSRENGNGGLVINPQNNMPPDPSSEYPEVQAFFEYLNIVLRHYINDTRSQLMPERFIQERIALMENRCPSDYCRIGMRPGFDSATKIKTLDFAEMLLGTKRPADVSPLLENVVVQTENPTLSKLLAESPLELKNFWTRDETIIVATTADPLANNRGYGDPFSGTLAAVDFIHCHQTDHHLSINRRRNLVMLFSHLNAEQYYQTNLRIPTNYRELQSIEQMKHITTQVFTSNIVFQLSKSIKTFFNIADLVILPKNIYIGRPQI